MFNNTNTKTVDAANTILTIMIPLIFPVPRQITGFAVDKVIEAPSVDRTQNEKGVDGLVASGYIQNLEQFTITLFPNSPDKVVFDTLLAQMKVQKRSFPVFIRVEYPSLREAYELNEGYLKSSPSIPSAQKVLQPIDFVFEFTSINPVII